VNFDTALSKAEIERLVILAEECAEVQKAAMKILRHGYESWHPAEVGHTNREALAEEIGHLRSAYYRLINVGDIDHHKILEYELRKEQEIGQYLHFQG
jgi:hypothetical protein